MTRLRILGFRRTEAFKVLIWAVFVLVKCDALSQNPLAMTAASAPDSETTLNRDALVESWRRVMSAMDSAVALIQNWHKETAVEEEIEAELAKAQPDPTLIQLRRRFLSADPESPVVCSGVGRSQLQSVAIYNCSNEPVDAIDMRLQYQSRIRCVDCFPNNGTTDPTFPLEPSLVLSPTCADTCCRDNSTTIMPTCECPEDRSGRNCEQGWPFTCSIQLVSPQLPCSDFFAPASLTKQLYTSPQCRLYSVHDESITLEYRVNCQNNQPLKLKDPLKFPYYMKTDQLVLSQDPETHLQLKVYNFHLLSDSRQVYTAALPLTPEQYLGNGSTTRFQINISQLYSMTNLNGARSNRTDYFTGGRMYFEVTFNATQNLVGMQFQPFHKQFLDFREFAPQTASVVVDTLLPLWIILGIVAGLVILGLTYWFTIGKKRAALNRIQKHKQA